MDLAWQLDDATDLAAVAHELRALAAELRAGHEAGWWLDEPMRRGRVAAARASRRRRASPRVEDALPPSPPAWRIRIVEEPPLDGHGTFDPRTADQTPVLSWTGDAFTHASGPSIARTDIADLEHRVRASGLPRGRWGLARARVTDNLDLVAAGSALRVHAVEDGTLVRTHEALTLTHAADGATTLLHAAFAYAEAARQADQMRAAGGVLDVVDGGFVHVLYPVAGR